MLLALCKQTWLRYLFTSVVAKLTRTFTWNTVHKLEIWFFI